MTCCSVPAQKYWLTGCSTGIFLLALMIGLLWPTVSLRYFLYPELVLENGTLNYENWKETPFPIYMKIYFFNWTNHEEVHNLSVKPHFTEMGPYVFIEKHIRTNLTWHNNGTVTFYQKRIWHFDEERSNGSLSDEVTNLNVIAATVAYSSRNFNSALKFAISLLMSQGRAPLIMTKTVQELLFDGYTDPLLTLVRANGNPNIPKPPFDKFGWFVDRNDSETYDGNFTMFTGANDISQLGVIQLWNDQPKANHYRGQCDNVKGTSGELWPPIKAGQKPPASIFATDVCRAITLNYDSDVTVEGIKGHKWIGDDSVFDNGIKYPEMSCFCSATEESCPDLLPGVFNASSCKFGAPAFISFPHFYLAHENYRENIEGMQPDKTKHEFSIAMEPRTGIPLKINAALQINLLMRSYPWTPINNVPELMMPMLWFQQVAELTPDLADQARVAVMLPEYGMWAAYAFAGLAGVLILLSAYCFAYRWRVQTSDEDDRILE